MAWLSELYTLQEARFPLGPDDLNLSTWRDLGLFRSRIEARKPRLF